MWRDGEYEGEETEIREKDCEKRTWMSIHSRRPHTHLVPRRLDLQLVKRQPLNHALHFRGGGFVFGDQPALRGLGLGELGLETRAIGFGWEGGREGGQRRTAEIIQR